MTRLDKILFSLVFVFCLTFSDVIAQGVSTVSATGHIYAEIVPVFSVNETSQLNFGRFSPGPQGGEIILTPQSTMSVLGSVFKSTGSYNAASFYVSGDSDASYSISLPTSPVMLTHTSEAKMMLIEDWVSIPEAGIGTGILQGGFQTVFVGATLKVGTLYDNPVGVYTGTFEITFDFN